MMIGYVVLFSAPWVLRQMGTPAEILPDAITYMRMACISVPLVGVYNYAASMLRSLGDSRTPLYFLIFACVLNIFLDLLFVGPFGLGVFGAALATSIAQLLAGLGCMLFAVHSNPYFRMKRTDFAFDTETSLRAVRLGLPLALQWGMIAVSSTGMQTAVNSFGTTAVAAFTATARIENLVHMPFGSLGQALATFAGQNYGANRMDRIRISFRQSTMLMAAIAGVLCLFMQLLGSLTVRAFVKDPAVIALGHSGLCLTSWFYLFLGMIYVSRGIQNGVGDAVFAFINGLIEMVCRIFLPRLLILLPGADARVIWWAAGLTWVISSFFCLMRYFSWQHRHMPTEVSLMHSHRRGRFSMV